MFRRLVGRSVVAALATLAWPMCQAGGFYIYQVNPVATIVPKAAWLNPAGMTEIDKMSLQASLVAVLPTVEFDPSVATAGGEDGGNAASGASIPDVSFVMPLGEKWRFGVSLTGLFGGAVDYGDDFVGRYSVNKVELGALGLTPSFAYKVSDKFSFGAGAALIKTTFDEDISINNNLFSPGAPDGEATFDELDDTGVQPYAGITYRFTPKLLLGAVYRGEMDLELEGDMDVDDFNGFSGKRDAHVDWTNPQTVELGVQIRLNDKSFLVLNADWEDWSVFSENVLTLDLAVPNDPKSATLDRNWDDTYHGGAYFARMFEKNVLLVGVNHDTSPVEDDDRTFDLAFDDTTRLMGSYWWMGNPARKFGITGSLVLLGDSSTDQTSQTVRAAGEFDKNSALLIAGTFLWTKGQ